MLGRFLGTVATKITTPWLAWTHLVAGKRPCCRFSSAPVQANRGMGFLRLRWGERQAAKPEPQMSGDTSGQGVILSFEPDLRTWDPAHGNEAENLASLALQQGQVTEAELLRISSLLPDEDRVRESTCSISGQRSFTMGAFYHCGKTGLRRNLNMYPVCSALLARLISSRFPGESFTSLALFRDIRQPTHKDSTNGRYNNLLLACSTFEGGGLWVQSDDGKIMRPVNGSELSGKIVSWGQGAISFDPHRWHSTESWTGTRLVLAAYSISDEGKLDAADKLRLSSLGFELPGKRKRDAVHMNQVMDQAEVDDLPFDQLKSGCEGPPMVGEFAGCSDEFVDGFGRCSPGRWRPMNRGRGLSDPAKAFAGRLKERVQRFVAGSIPDLARATFSQRIGCRCFQIHFAPGRWSLTSLSF